MQKLLSHWKIASCLVATVVGASVFSGVEPTLPIHLQRTFHADASTIGLLFMAIVIPTFLSPVIGAASDKYGRWVVSCTGTVLTAISAPLIAYPSKHIWLEIPPLMLFGLASSMITTPLLPQMGEVVHKLGGGAYGRVYALFNMAYSIGMLFGPIVGGILLDKITFWGQMCVFSACLWLAVPVMFDWSMVRRTEE